MRESDNHKYRVMRENGATREEAARVAGIVLKKPGFPSGSRGKGIFSITFARLMRHSIIHPRTGCFVWVGAVTRGRSAEYGCISYYSPEHKKARSEAVHRVSQILFNATIPDGWDVDHKSDCVSKRCWNPDHIRAVTKAVNCAAREAAKRRVQWALNLSGNLDTEKYRKHGIIVMRDFDPSRDDEQRQILMNAKKKQGLDWHAESGQSQRGEIQT